MSGWAGRSHPAAAKENQREIQEHQENIVAVKTEKLLAWGSKSTISAALSKFSPKDPEPYDISDPVKAVRESTIVKSFYEEALAHTLVNGKPLHLRKNRRQFYAVVDHRQADNSIFDALKNAARYKDRQGNETPGQICGSFRPNIFWSEAASIRLEEKNGQLWLLLRPDIWLKPLSERQNYRDEIKAKKRFRYNQRAYDFLNAWITIRKRKWRSQKSLNNPLRKHLHKWNRMKMFPVLVSRAI